MGVGAQLVCPQQVFSQSDNLTDGWIFPLSFDQVTVTDAPQFGRKRLVGVRGSSVESGDPSDVFLLGGVAPIPCSSNSLI
uniref:Uncharacterized protein n=1 Tax=Knipowitschia caucasica TaxID=637954 RepID=A0AAV2K2J2_KNICA